VVDVKQFEIMKDSFVETIARKKAKVEQLSSEKEKLQSIKEKLESSQKAREIVVAVGQQTQQKLEYHITNLGNMALLAVIPNSPAFSVRFEVRRNQTECDLFLDDMKPTDAYGGGALDILSFALRIAYWSLKKNRPTFVLDEPFKFLSADLQSRASEMIKEVSESLGLQILMVSHQEDININADRTFLVRKAGKISKVKEVGNE